MQRPTDTKVTVIPKSEIPAITSIIHQGKKHDLGELRDFKKHPLLEKFIPSNAQLSVSWTHLDQQKSLKNHQHPEPSLIIVCEGNGYITGELNAKLNAGDVVLIPTECIHGFKGGTGGMNCLSIQFEEMGGLYEDLENPLVNFIENEQESPNQISNLDDLLAYNKKCMHQFFDNEFFSLITSDTLKKPEAQKRFLDSLQIWTDKNQLLLLTRQAMCVNESYRKLFLQHLHEELDHDKLFLDRSSPGDLKDPIIDAIACWFILQMYQLDNVEKAAIIHLVIENASDYYHKVARPIFNKNINDEYFKVHEADTAHAQWGIDLLQGYNAKVYQQVGVVLKQAWAMLDAMVSRVVELTKESQ